MSGGTLSGATDDLAAQVGEALSPYVRQVARDAAEEGYAVVREKFVADKDALALEIAEAARPRIKEIVAELTQDPDLQVKIGQAREELRAGFTKTIIVTSLLSAAGATLGTWLLMRAARGGRNRTS